MLKRAKPLLYHTKDRKRIGEPSADLNGGCTGMTGDINDNVTEEQNEKTISNKPRCKQ